MTVGVEVFEGLGGDDFINGRGGFDRAMYGLRSDDHVTGGIDVNLAAGTVHGDDSIGSDTLRSVEAIRATHFADRFDATGFGQAGALNVGSSGTFNDFEGLGGNDFIIGNGNTQLNYLNASGGVSVDLVAGTASGDASVGNDTFSGVSQVVGSMSADTLLGTGGSNYFEGRGGIDTIDGRGGFDTVGYNGDTATTSGINVNLLAGTVTGDATIGNDTLISIEFIQGTRFADTYAATGFVGFNQFEGRGGNDSITGNGNTQIAYNSATEGVTVTLGAGGSATSLSRAYANLQPYFLAHDPNADPAGVGLDSIASGVSHVRGGAFGDNMAGNTGSNTLDGQGGNDALNGGGGTDTLIGGTGADRFFYASGVVSITDFDHGEGVLAMMRPTASI